MITYESWFWGTWADENFRLWFCLTQNELCLFIVCQNLECDFDLPSLDSYDLKLETFLSAGVFRRSFISLNSNSEFHSLRLMKFLNESKSLLEWIGLQWSDNFLLIDTDRALSSSGTS